MGVTRGTLASVLVFAIAGCSSGTETLRTFWDATLRPVSPARVAGTASGLSEAGRTRLTIEIRNGTPGATYGWRTETGSCDAPGGTLGGAGLYPPMTAGPSGGGSADASIPSVFQSGSGYVARVFQATPDGEVIVACGEFSEST